MKTAKGGEEGFNYFEVVVLIALPPSGGEGAEHRSKDYRVVRTINDSVGGAKVWNHKQLGEHTVLALLFMGRYFHEFYEKSSISWKYNRE